MLSAASTLPSSSSDAPVAPDWRRVLEDPTPQSSFVGLEVEGTLPSSLRGTFVRNGPALSHGFGVDYEHWFDGDGGLVAVRLGEGRADGALRLVETEGLAVERRRGRRVYPGFGSHSRSWRHPWGVKNVANTNVIAWQGRLLALWEGGRPHEIDPRTLRTRGETDLGGVVRGAFSAHPHRVHARRATYNFGVRPTAWGSRLELFELPDEGPARRLASIARGDLPLVHDFIATERHLVVLVSPVFIDRLSFLLRPRTYAQSLRWRPERGTEVIIIPIDEPDRVMRWHTEPFWQWHFANAFEQGDRIVADLVRFDRFSLIGNSSDLHGTAGVVDHGVPARITIDRRTRSLEHEPWSDRSAEFPRVAPRVDGREHRWVHLAVHSDEARRQGALTDRLAMLDVSTGRWLEYDVGPSCFVSEPVFAPRPEGVEEDDGWVLCMVYDAGTHRSHMAVIDARDPCAGPVARVWFPGHVHYTFHGSWVPQQ